MEALMPFVERSAGVVIALYANFQTGYAEEWLDEGDAEVIAFRAPKPVPPHLNGGMLIRFAATAPVMVYENLGLAGVTRVAKGRYRVNHATPMVTDSYSVVSDVLDTNVRWVRATARTVNFVEVRITDQTGAAQDANEVTVKIERVI